MTGAIKTIGLVWLLAVLAIGAGGTWLQYNQHEVEVAVVGATAAYDPDATALEKAKVLANGHANGKAIIRQFEAEREKARRAEIDRINARDGWGDGSASDLPDDSS